MTKNISTSIMAHMHDFASETKYSQKEKADIIFQMFREKIGSEHIATPITIETLLTIIEKEQPERILELGGGIGTISYTLLLFSSARVDIYEDNEFCRKELNKTLAQFKERFRLIESYRMLPPEKEYDLIIVDGGAGKKEDGGFARSIWFYIKYLNNVKIVYFEGYRHIQRQWARKALRDAYVYKQEVILDKVMFGNKIKGGLVIRCIPSRSLIKRFLNYWYWELTEVDSLRKKLAYRVARAKNMFK